MRELRSTSREPRLDLDNFNSAKAQRSRYVLTSPRSLESCTRLGVKPVELLIKSLKEFVAERRGTLPCEAMRVMHEAYERERLKLLQMCRQERRRIIRAAGDDRWPGANAAVSGPEVVSVNKLRGHTGVQETTGSITYADLCFKGEPASRSSCSHRDRSTVCTFSLGDLRHTPATERKLDRLTKDIHKEMRVTVSERDRKIAALMLVKHQEEQTCLELCQHEEQERQEARRHEEALRAQADTQRGNKLRQGMRRWHEELEARRRLRERREEERARQLEQELVLQEDRWRRLREEVEGQRRERTEATQKEAERRKRYQEQLLREKVEVEKSERERERRVAAEKEQKARRSKGSRQKEERRRLQEGNRRELLRHILLKLQVEQQGEEEKVHMRSALEEKLRRSRERHTEVVEARLRELQERAAREEEQARRARQRATLLSHRQHTHKLILGQLSQRRSERAAVHAAAQQRTRAQQTRRLNEHRQRRHQRLREEIQREEEAVKKVREGCVFMKDWRRARLRRRREQMQEEAHRMARASFHMRDRVRQQTHRRTFDQMALQAQLSAFMSRMDL
ncbi:coiled-coil domain-containing protein 177 [Pseudoliparis swirei]|uniref:coiled-coil domain-containing protein 177 n=1 Tax=Pseudoliparis swirei TaxID=2059687 RepID=UPI0024BED74D|nr:coiled-coil domain-containing protein 177 [Pseudoliparis swirei]